MRRLLVLFAAVAAVACAGCLPLPAPPGPAPLRYRDEVFSDVDITRDVVYGHAMNEDNVDQALDLDLYRPSGDTVTKRPAIVWVHGGSFLGGDKLSPEIVDEATTFALKGYVNVSIDYRLTRQGCSAAAPSGACVAEIIDATHDAQAAVRFLRANADTYGIDSDRIAIGGSSAGAIVALDTGYNPDDPGDSGNPGFSSSVQAAVSLSGAKIVGVYNVFDAPSLLFHGTADTTVPYAWAVGTVNDAHAAGLTSYLTAWDGDGHVPYVQHRQQILDETTTFLYWQMYLANVDT